MKKPLKWIAIVIVLLILTICAFIYYVKFVMYPLDKTGMIYDETNAAYSSSTADYK